MFVVVIGDLDRQTEEDENQVLDLMEELKNSYSDLIIVSAACKKGIGLFVKQRCLKNKNNPEFGFVEYDVKVWTPLDEARLAKAYISRNPSLIEIGEVFHIFTSGKEKGHIPDLIDKVKNRKLPLVVHNREGSRSFFNYAARELASTRSSSADSISSNQLKDLLK